MELSFYRLEFGKLEKSLKVYQRESLVPEAESRN